MIRQVVDFEFKVNYTWVLSMQIKENQVVALYFPCTHPSLKVLTWILL